MDFINQIIRFSLKNRLAILLGAVLLIIGGIYSSRNMDIDVFPDLTAPTVVIMTEANGMAAEEVEQLVTFPIETAVNGATNVRRVRSASMYGYSFVWTEFNWGMDIFQARQIISEKMVALGESLPTGITPVLAPQSSIMGEILFIGMQSDSVSMMDLRTLAEWVVKPAILATGGVSQVTIIGGDYKQYQILADPIKMARYDVRMDELEATARNLSANSSGGVIRDYGNEFALRGMGRTCDLEEIANTLVKRNNGSPIRLGDIATIQIGSAIKQGYASQNASPAIILSVSKQPNINTLNVTEKIEKNLVEIQKSLPKGVVIDSHIFRQADFIETSVSNVGHALIEGALFVIIILFLFLNSYRTTLISIVAIPLSLLGTLVILYLLGLNVNTMTLGGMCIAIGSLVDDAIIDVENVYKRLKQNHRLPKEERRSSFEVVFDASSEIRSSILNATFIIMVAFMPLFFLSGMEGRMLQPLGIAYIISLFMSLIVAMTVTPLLCRQLLAKEDYLKKNEKESWTTRHLSSIYHRILSSVLNHKRSAVVATGVLLVSAILLLLTMGQSFLPDFNEGSAVITAVAKPGVSLDVNHELGNVMERELLKIPEVTSTARRTGRGELDEHSQATNSAELDVRFELNGKSRSELFNEMRAHLSTIPGVVFTIGQPLGHRIDHILSGTQANIAIKLFGTDLTRMFMTGNQIKSAIEGIDGLVDLSVEQQTETPQLQIRADREALARYGITMEEFNHFISLAFAGEKVADIYEGQRSYDLIIRLNDRYTENIEALKSALIDTDNGTKVPLQQVAKFVSTGGPGSIMRENVQRKLVISANVSGRDVGSVVNDIKNTIEQKIQLPEGYRVEYGGQFESAQSATRTLMIALIVSLFIIFILLYSEFKNSSLACIVLISLPLALIGGVYAIRITSGVVSIPSIIGFITLFGVATRNGILMISQYKRLQEAGVPLHETILQGSIDRLNPILMTALTSALALIPLVFNGDQPGNEIQSPMAIVVLGGLLTSTLLNLIVLPIIYEAYQKRKKQ